MKLSQRWSWIALAGIASAPSLAVQYNVRDLGTFGGYGSAAFGINSAGQVVGWATNAAGSRRAFVNSGGVMTDLGTLGVDVAAAINDSGEIVGSAGGHAIRLKTNVVFDLGTLGETTSAATSINNSGQIVGSAGFYRAFSFSGGTMTDIGSLGVGQTGASGISDTGIISGYAHVGSNTHAFRYSAGIMADLGTLGGKSSVGRAVNDAGQVVGESDLVSGPYKHAFLSSGGVMTDLGAMGNRSSYAMAINSAGEIVGYAGVWGGRDEGFIRIGGVTANLNDLRDSTSGGYEIWYAYDINDSGQIVGQAYHNVWGYRAVLLTPTNLVAGRIDLQDFAGSAEGLSADVSLYRSDGSLQQTWIGTLDANGHFFKRLDTGLGGNLTLRVQVGHWLRKRVSFTFAQAGYLAVSVVNGDVDSDNTVTVFDYDRLSSAFDSSTGDENWDDAADLDGDGTVTVFDYDILSRNFDRSGDD